MELSFLYAIPRTEALDTFFLGLTKLVGSYGQLFLFLGIALLFFNRRAGTLVLLLACLIGFSRMYLFMHFPTDVLAAVVLGVCIGFLSVRYARSILKH